MNITSYTDIFKQLSNAEAGELIHALLAYNSHEEYTFTSTSLKLIYDNIVQDLKKRERISNIRSKAGKQGMNSRYKRT